MPSVAQQESPLAGSLEEAKQRYETTKKALKTGISKKRQIDRTLTDLESQIFLFEGSYLASTSASGGNIVKGFDGYLKSTATGGHNSKSAAAAAAAQAMNPNDVPIEDRMFSNSSSTYTRSLQLKANEGRSREQSPSLSKKGDKSEKTDKPEKEGKSEKSSKSEKGKSEKGKKDKDDDRSEIGTPSTSGKKDKHAVDSTPTKGKKRDREKEASALVNGSSKKKRKDDD